MPLQFAPLLDDLLDLAKANGFVEPERTQEEWRGGPTRKQRILAWKPSLEAFFKEITCAKRRPPRLPPHGFVSRRSTKGAYNRVKDAGPHHRLLYAHRMVCTLSEDSLEDHAMVLHKCHHGRCLSLNCLKVGDARENAQDRTTRRKKASAQERMRCHCGAFLKQKPGQCPRGLEKCLNPNP